MERLRELLQPSVMVDFDATKFPDNSFSYIRIVSLTIVSYGQVSYDLLKSKLWLRISSLTLQSCQCAQVNNEKLLFQFK